MTELLKILAILKARWPEAVLIVGGQVMLRLMAEIFHLSDPEQAAEAGIAPLLVMMGVGLVWLTMFFGFLRSVFSEPEQTNMPTELLAKGKPFFWRALGFSIIAPLAIVLLAQVLLVVLAGILPDVSVVEPPIWVAGAASAAAALVLMKYLVLAPAVMVVKDAPLLRTLVMPRQYQLRDAKIIIYLYLAVGALQGIKVGLGIEATGVDSNLAWVGFFSAVVQFLILPIMVAAVRFTGSFETQEQPADEQ